MTRPRIYFKSTETRTIGNKRDPPYCKHQLYAQKRGTDLYTSRRYEINRSAKLTHEDYNKLVDDLKSGSANRVESNVSIGTFIEGVTLGDRLNFHVLHNTRGRFFTYRAKIAQNIKFDCDPKYEIYEIGLNHELHTNNINFVVKVKSKTEEKIEFQENCVKEHAKLGYELNIHLRHDCISNKIGDLLLEFSKYPFGDDFEDFVTNLHNDRNWKKSKGKYHNYHQMYILFIT
jgi:hypothetical protein